MYCFASYCSFNEINTVYTKVYSADIYILLKRSLESFARISLYKTSADSEGVDMPMRYGIASNCKLTSTSFGKSIFKITERVFLCHQNLDVT